MSRVLLVIGGRARFARAKKRSNTRTYSTRIYNDLHIWSQLFKGRMTVSTVSHRALHTHIYSTQNISFVPKKMLGKTGEKTQQVKVQRNTKEIIHHSASRELTVKIKCQTQHFQGFDFIMKCKVPVDILRLMAFQRFSKKFSIKLLVPIISWWMRITGIWIKVPLSARNFKKVA